MESRPSQLLIIENDHGLQELLVQTAQEAGIPTQNIKTASTNKEAQEKLMGPSAHLLQAALIELPEYLSLFEELRQTPCPNQHIPVVAIDSKRNRYRERHCLDDLNAAYYIPQSFDIETIIMALQKVTQQR